MTADYQDSLRTDAHDAALGHIDYLAATPADLMRLAHEQERDEIANRVEGHATGLGQDFETVREARICDCEDDSHPYAPTTPGWAWKPVELAERSRLYYPDVHVRYRTTVTVWIGDAS